MKTAYAALLRLYPETWREVFGREMTVVFDEAQTDFAKSGYRPVVEGIKTDVEGANDPSNPFPTPAKLLTIEKDFGGWPAAQKKFFDDGGIVPKIQEATGKTG